MEKREAKINSEKNTKRTRLIIFKTHKHNSKQNKQKKRKVPTPSVCVRENKKPEGIITKKNTLQIEQN